MDVLIALVLGGLSLSGRCFLQASLRSDRALTCGHVKRLYSPWRTAERD